MPQRYSRHYYDLSLMSKHEVKANALKQLDFLQWVVDFKMKFYPRGWAYYDKAKPCTFKLVPPEYRFATLEKDHISIREMLFGNVSSFESMISAFKILEYEINELR